jgi:hypothetical protein
MPVRRRAGGPYRVPPERPERPGHPVRDHSAPGAGNRGPGARCRARARRCPRRRRNRSGAGRRRREQGCPGYAQGRLGGRRRFPASRDRLRAVLAGRGRLVSGRAGAPAQVVSSLLQRLMHRFLSSPQSVADSLAPWLASRHFRPGRTGCDPIYPAGLRSAPTSALCTDRRHRAVIINTNLLYAPCCANRAGSLAR